MAEGRQDWDVMRANVHDEVVGGWVVGARAAKLVRVEVVVPHAAPSRTRP